MEVYPHSGPLGTLLLVFTAYKHRPRVAHQGVLPTAESPRVLAHPTHLRLSSQFSHT